MCCTYVMQYYIFKTQVALGLSYICYNLQAWLRGNVLDVSHSSVHVLLAFWVALFARMAAASLPGTLYVILCMGCKSLG